MKRALVFSGGGARGAYELGVWKALDSMKIKVDIVTGASIGALNGALYITDSYALAEKLWLHLTPNQVIKTDETDPKVVYAKFVKETITGGADTSPLEALLTKAVDEKKARESKIIFGISTCEFPSLKPLQLTLDQIPNGKLIDYLMASAAAYPTLKPKEIDDKKYIDGGYHDNLPINYAIQLGADEVVAVNLQAVGIYRKTKNKNVIVDTIIPSRDLGSFLMFDKDLVKRNSQIGFQDTYKFYGEYEGFIYTFAKGEITEHGAELAFELRQLTTKIFQSKQNRFISFAQLYSSKRLFKDVENTHRVVYDHSTINLMRGLDVAGNVFEMDDLKIYSLASFKKELLSRVTKTMTKYPEFQKDIRSISSKVHDVSNVSNQVLTCNILQSLIAYLDKSKAGFEVYTLFMLYPENALAALTIYAIILNEKIVIPEIK
ncbi:MAG: patatin-like phospholipase family protein [Bacilli bacterium]|nr:patatin-like phospholipase family protein [Bacilli bacterium]